MNRNEIMELTGAEEWEWVVEAFENKSALDVEAELDQMFPAEDNVKLAEAIVEALK